MLREVRLNSFKCFESASFHLAPLTLLTGYNGGGKSTVVQSVLLLHQGLADDLDRAGRRVLRLNGSAVSLGSVRDVVDKISGASSFEIGIEGAGAGIRWSFAAKDAREEVVAQVGAVRWGSSLDTLDHQSTDATLLSNALLEFPRTREIVDALAQLCYVPADRVGPAETYPLDDPRQHRIFGARAALSIGNLYWRKEEDVYEALRHPDLSVTPKLPRQVEAWLGDLFPGCGLDIQLVRNANLVRLALRTSSATDFHRPQHVGFGLSYVLPVLIALIGAERGRVVVIDGPEAHLHPRAQGAIGKLCARVAAAGVQVIIETHSDHIVNGVRVAVRDGVIPAGDVGVLFFESPTVAPHDIRIDSDGRFESWPDGFFDEGARLLDALLLPRQ